MTLIRQHSDGALVYFARGLASGLWKIGVSYDPAERIVTLVSERRESIELLATMPGTRETERETHARFAHVCVEGEWFRDDGSIAAFVAALPAEQRGSYVREYRGPRVTRPREVIEAERAAQMAVWRAGYREHHGHEYRIGKRVDGCAVCAAELARGAAATAMLRAMPRNTTPSPPRIPKRRPTTVIPPAFAVGRWSNAWPEVKS